MALMEKPAAGKLLLDDTVSLTAVIEASQNLQSHTEYIIRVQRGVSTENSWTVIRRYSDFDMLNNSLLISGLNLPLPPKKLIGNMDREFIAERQKGLQAYLNFLTQHHILSSCELVKKFLDTNNYSANYTEIALQQVSMYFRSDLIWEVVEPLKDMGWRLRKRYFLVKNKEQPKERQVLSWVDFGPDKFLSDKDLQSMMKLLPSLSHPYICPVTYASTIESSAVVIRIFNEKGTLRDHICKVKPKEAFLKKYCNPKKIQGLELQQIRTYGRQILEALKFLHDKGFPYGHLHASNVVVEDNTCKLLDIENSILGLPSYYRPYVTQFRKINTTESIDVYSFGHLLYEMTYGRPPDAIPVDQYPSVPYTSVVSVLQSILSTESCKTGMPTVSQLLQTPLFSDVLLFNTEKAQFKCENFFTHQAGAYHKETTRCGFMLSLLTGRALDWTSAVWDHNPQARNSFSYFSGLIWEVFEYPVGGRDILVQLLELLCALILRRIMQLSSGLWQNRVGGTIQLSWPCSVKASPQLCFYGRGRTTGSPPVLKDPPSLSSVANPLTFLLHGKPKRLKWSDGARAAFVQLKESFTAPILKHPDPSRPFIAEVDASSCGIGAVLSQRHGTLGKLPFFPLAGEPSDVPAVDDWITRSREIWDAAHVHFRRPSGDNEYRQIAICARTLVTSPRFICPFPITRQINPVTYQLQIPSSYCISPSFHVTSKLKEALKLSKECLEKRLQEEQRAVQQHRRLTRAQSHHGSEEEKRKRKILARKKSRQSTYENEEDFSSKYNNNSGTVQERVLHLLVLLLPLLHLHQVLYLPDSTEYKRLIKSHFPGVQPVTIPPPPPPPPPALGIESVPPSLHPPSVNGKGRSALLSSIQAFSKGQLKKSETKDRSNPHI
ncbi:hypothetical protein QTP86_013831 [Hemibagrus guttatus]|nr:hypothetical protein QTP86_013831 [Hemibagrus guttatus]